MSENTGLSELAVLAAKLPPHERRLLAETILRDLNSEASDQTTRGRKWREIRGSVSHPLCGADAQAWVNQTRRESDEHRQGRNSP